MKFSIDNEIYDVIIEKKNNKNTYIRVKQDLNIYVTTSYLVSNNEIEKMLNKNIIFIKKMINREKQKLVKESEYYYLGRKYNIITIPQINSVSISNNKLLINDKNNIDNWYKKEANRLFRERLNYILSYFNERIPHFDLRIKKMRTRWGVCNRKNNTITLNLELIKKDIIMIDYVIIHELCHFVYSNHSIFFWNLVEKYVPNCKRIRKEMKEI